MVVAVFPAVLQPVSAIRKSWIDGSGPDADFVIASSTAPTTLEATARAIVPML